jgi:L-iditol 2-dehydrogenase
MSRRVRAAVMMAPRALELDTFPYPELEPGAVLMKVIYSGICGTDKHTYRGESKQYAGTPHERDLTYPLICGHENVGTVAEIGPGGAADSEGRALAVGDRIVPAANVPCGQCYYCRNDYPYFMCQHLEDYGNSLHCGRPPSLFGGWAEYMYLLPGTPIFRVPDELPSEVAAFTEVMSVTHGLDTARVLAHTWGGPPFGESVAVVGVGPLGFAHLIKARALGCGALIAIDRFESRLALAREMGATLTLSADRTSPEERLEAVLEHTNGRGADLVADCSGVPQTFPESLKLVRLGGVVVEAGAFVDMGPVPINPNADVCTKNVSIVGVGGERHTAYVPTMQMLARNLDRLPLHRIVSHKMPLERAVEAVELAQTDAAMKVVMAPWGEGAG